MLHPVNSVRSVTVVFTFALIVIDRNNSNISAIFVRVTINSGLFNTTFARGWLLHFTHPCRRPVGLCKRIDRLFQINDELVEWTLPGLGLLYDFNVRHCFLTPRTCTLELSALSCSMCLAR